ncbi:MAG TPA: hypothetical protein VGP07_13695 [Polyangia bacterium]
MAPETLASSTLPSSRTAGDVAAWPWTRAATFALVVAVAFVVSLGPISDGDIYWHLAAGREMTLRRALLRTDPFTSSAAGRPWIDVHWLFQLGVYGIYRLHGFVGLAIAKAAAVAVTAALLTRTAERSGGVVARSLCAVTLVATLYLVRHLLPIRPVIVTALCLALFLHTLESARDGAGPRVWARLPLLQLIWVNCQGLAPLGPLLVGAYGCEAALARLGGRSPERDPLRPLVATFVLCLLASFVTPYGLAAVALPGHLLARITPGQQNIFSTAIAENIPPFVLERTAPAQIGHFKWVLLGLAASLVAFRPRLRLAHLLILAAFLALALMANRNVLLLYLLAPPLIAIGVGANGPSRSGWLRSRWLAVAALVAVAAVGALASVALAREAAVGAPTPFHFPVASARRLAAQRATGPVFAPDQAGGYLSFTVPGLRPYLDTRLMLHTAAEYQAFLALLDDPTGFEALATAQSFRYVVLTTIYPDRYLGLAAHLARDPRWKLVYLDGSELLFAREGDALDLGQRAIVDRIADELPGRFGDGAVARAARLDLARTLAVVGQPRQALHVLADLDTRAAAQLRARALFIAGELAAAESLTQILLRQDADDETSLTLMAEIALARGHLDGARDWLRRALTVDPYDAGALSAMARLERIVTPIHQQ